MVIPGTYVLTEEGGERGRALGGTGGRKPSTLAGEGHEEFGPAGAAPHTGEAVVQDAAVEVRADRSVREPPPEAVTPLVALLPLLSHLTVQCLAALSREVLH